MGNTAFHQISEQSSSGTSTGVLHTVPAGKAWRVLSTYVTVTAGAATGNRKIALRAQSSTGRIVAQWNAGNVIASAETRALNWAPGNPNDTAFDAEGLMLRAFPDDFMLPEGYALRVLDSTGISSGDTLTAVRAIVEEFIA